jgi:hypothetical protein
MYERPLRLPRLQSRRPMDDSLALRVALRELPTELQHKIVMMAREPPPAPKKNMSDRLKAHMKRWANPNRPNIMPRRVLFH